MNAKYRVVLQLNSSDEGVQKGTVGHITNIVKSGEDIKIELVAHGSGAELLLKTSRYENIIADLQGKGVDFVVCKNTLVSMNLQEGDFLADVGFVESAVVHLIKRQNEGWAYLKEG